MSATALHPPPLPDAAPQLEEAAAAQPADTAAAMAFALWRVDAWRAAGDRRPTALVATHAWLNERGRPFARGAGAGGGRWLLVTVEREAEALWALEEALKSGAVAGAVGAISAAPFVATRRLDFAAKTGRAAGIVLRAAGAGDLSAARLRWRIAAAASAPHPFDARAPGAARITAELVRNRNGRGAAWKLEQDDEAHGFTVAGGLADHGLVKIGAARAA